MQEFTNRDIQEFTKNVQGYTRIYKQYAGIYENLPKCAGIYGNLSTVCKGIQ